MTLKCIPCQIDKPHNFLLFEPLNFGMKGEHLKQQTDKDKDIQTEK
jgi:hypothetical protein